MRELLNTWHKFLGTGGALNEMRYIERMFLDEKDFLDTLPAHVRALIDTYDVLDFAFEEYKNVFPGYTLGGINPIKFFVPTGNREYFFDYSSADEHNIIRPATEAEMLERGKSIPVLPKEWYNAFLKHYGQPIL
jgi:hypothetical protein